MTLRSERPAGSFAVVWATVTSCAAPPERNEGAHWITHEVALGQSDSATTPRARASARIATRAASPRRIMSSTSRKNGPRWLVFFACRERG
jgi:hypothetical protein